MIKLKASQGLIVIEVKHSNPNGSGDDGYPRVYGNNRGLISSVSVKRKARNILCDKESPVWDEVSSKFSPKLKKEEFGIFETPDRNTKAMIKELVENIDKFHSKHWDARIWGNLLLEESKNKDKDSKDNRTSIRTGTVVVGHGRSIAPIEIIEQTITKMTPVEEGKSRGMAPGGLKIVRHGIYTIPYFVNPQYARHTNCSDIDIKLWLNLIPYLYVASRSHTRPEIQILHAWHVDFKSILGANRLDIIEALQPVKKGDSESPSADRSEYIFPTLDVIREKFDGKFERLLDLMEEEY